MERLPDSKQYTNRFNIASESRPSVSYIVAQNKKTGEWSCSCPAWITKKAAVRDCKHMREIRPVLCELGLMVATGDPKSWKDAARAALVNAQFKQQQSAPVQSTTVGGDRKFRFGGSDE